MPTISFVILLHEIDTERPLSAEEDWLLTSQALCFGGIATASDDTVNEAVKDIGDDDPR